MYIVQMYDKDTGETWSLEISACSIAQAIGKAMAMYDGSNIIVLSGKTSNGAVCTAYAC